MKRHEITKGKRHKKYTDLRVIFLVKKNITKKQFRLEKIMYFSEKISIYTPSNKQISLYG